MSCHLLHWLLVHLHPLISERVEVVWILDIVDKNGYVFLHDAPLIDEICGCVHINATLLAGLKELLSFIEEVDRKNRLLNIWPHRKLLLDHRSLLLRAGMRLDVVFSHEVQKLPWQLVQGFFCEQMGIVFEVVERYELDDISFHVFTVSI